MGGEVGIERSLWKKAMLLRMAERRSRSELEGGLRDD